MTEPVGCSVQGCKQPAAASLQVRSLCREHFLFTCHEQLELCRRWQEDRLSGNHRTAESVRQFCHGGSDSAAKWLNTRANVEVQKSLPVFLLLANIAEQLDTNNEVESLLRSLRGEYIEPGPGADIVQNPSIL